jgi:hypothetical protein
VAEAAPAARALPAPVPLRPLRLIDIFDGAFSVLKLRPRTVVGITAIFVLPLQVLTAYIARDQLGSTFDFSRSFSTTIDETEGGGWEILLAYAATIPLILIGAALGRLVAGWYGGTDLSTRELLRALGPRLPALLVCWLVIHLAETAGMMVFCVGTLFVWPMVLCCGPAIGVEDHGIRAGLLRSWQLGSRLYWECFWVAICTGIIAQVLSISLSLLPTLLADFLGPTWGWLVLAAGNTAASLITIPFVAAAAALTYLDVRVRTEALDLELRAVEVLGKAPAG